MELNSSKTQEGAHQEKMATKETKEVAKTQVPEYLKAIGMDPRKFWPKKYRFTREPIPGQLNPLVTSQRNFYESNGYIVIDETVSLKLLQAIQNQYYDNYRGKQQTISPTNLIEPKLFNKFATSQKLIQYVGCFTDEQVLLMTSNLVNTFKVHQANASSDYQQQQQQVNKNDNRKDDNRTVNDYEDLWTSNKNHPPTGATLLAASANQHDNQQSSSETQQTNKAQMTASYENSGYQFLYRDWMYLPFRPIDKIVCAITALEPIDQVLLVVPGTHRVGQCTISTEFSEYGELNEVFESAPVNMRTMVESAKKQSKYINLKPGQTLFYSPGLVHGYSNDLVNSKKNYLAVISYYAAGDCKYINYEPSKDLIDHKSLPLPAGLADFGSDNPADYKSWVGKVKMVRDSQTHL